MQIVENYGFKAYAISNSLCNDHDGQHLRHDMKLASVLEEMGRQLSKFGTNVYRTTRVRLLEIALSLALFPGPAQLSVVFVLIAMETCAGPGNKATLSWFLTWAYACTLR